MANEGAFFGGASFEATLTAAINDMMEHGFDSADRLARWVEAIRAAAIRSLVPEHVLERTLAEALGKVYRDKIERGGILKLHPEVARFTLDRVAPRLRDELTRRIMSNAALIRMNRQQMVNETVQRFAGWGSSIPAGGTDVTMRREVKEQVRKPLASLPFKDRRCLTDQSHKFVASLNNILATDAGAIALIWNSHWREKGYNYRVDHKERDGQVYLLRESWAKEKGLVKPGPAGYYDEVTAVGQEVSCRCFATYLYSVRRLPGDMVTEKGRAELARIKAAA